MAIDSRDKRASALAGTLAPLVAPYNPDNAWGAADRQHVGGWVYRGIAAAAPSDNLPFVSEVYGYDGAGATGSISGATLLAGQPYNGTGATGSTSGATVLSGQPYDGAGATGSTSGVTILDEDVTYD